MPRWIDMRYELECLTYGDHRTIPQGAWIVVRFMRIGQYSPYWNPNTNEAIGGPKWLYDDYILRSVTRPNPTGLQVTNIAGPGDLSGQGKEDINKMLFSVLPMSIPKTPVHIPRIPLLEDVVYEIDKAASIDIPTPPYRVISRYNILDVSAVRGDFGRAEIIYLYCSRVHGEG